MPRLTIIYDAMDPPLQISLDQVPSHARKAVSIAALDVADDLEGKDIYKLAERLAGMLLEQLS